MKRFNDNCIPASSNKQFRGLNQNIVERASNTFETQVQREYECFLSGSTHQADPRFRGANAQCVANSACASIFSVIKGRQLENRDIDTILQNGDDLYMLKKPELPRGIVFLNPEELPTQICVGNFSATIEPMDNNWLNNGLFPNHITQKEAAVLQLTINIEQIFDENFDEHNDNVIFTGQNFTVAFWKWQDSFYLFNSHEVNEDNVSPALRGGKGAARIFKCYNVRTLARLLLVRDVFDGTEYSMHKLRVCSFVSRFPRILSVTDLQRTSETRSIVPQVSPVVSLSDSQRTLETLQLSPVISLSNSQKTSETKSFVSQVSQVVSLTDSLGTSQSIISTPSLSSSRTVSETSILRGFSLPCSPILPLTVASPIPSASFQDNSLSQSKTTSPSQPKSIKTYADAVLSTPSLSSSRSVSETSVFRGFGSPCSPTLSLTTTRLPLASSNNCSLSQSILMGSMKTTPPSSLSQSTLRDFKHIFTYENKSNTVSEKPKPKSYKIKTVLVEPKTKLQEPVVVLENIFSGLLLDESEVPESKTSEKRKRGRPIKGKSGRKKTKVNAHLDAVKKYNKKNPKVNQEAVKRYTLNKPGINQKAVRKYTLNKPEVNQKAVRKYSLNKPEVNQKAVRKYGLNKPEVHQEAVRKYTFNNPEIHRQSVKKYSQTHPEVNLNSVKSYQERNPEIIKTAKDNYESHIRHVDELLRRSSKLIGEMKDKELDAVRPFALKKPSLLTLDTFKCSNCGARLFEEEKSRKEWCCKSGANNVQNFAPLTEDFYSHPAFIQRPRAYNNMFAFSALGVTNGFHQPVGGISFLKIQGRVYHRVFDLSYTKTTNNLGLYINDASEREQLATGLNLDTQVIQSIHNFIQNVNPYINCFKRLSQEPSDEAFIQFQLTSRASHGNILGDSPISTEVSAIISNLNEEYIPKSIAIWKIGESKPHTVDIMHPCYESFQYPLLYPEGNPGWYPNKIDNKGKKLTQNRYIRCLLLSEPRFSEIGQLSEEWLVDMFCRIIEERLRYLKSIQSNQANSLRSAPLSEVEMSIITADETIQGEGILPGRIYLPNTFTGGPRYMKTKYSDAIAIVSRLGNPSFFLTFTCNTKWPEIQESITGNRANPLICARAFNLRLVQLLNDIRCGKWFGKCVYIMHVIEFQKRGLPHAHICFRVEGGGPANNIDVDKFVRADIPDASEADGRLRKAVLTHMIHGPCGPPNRTNLPCWNSETKKCSKFFPKPETPITFINDKGYVNLRRDSNNTGVIKYLNKSITVNDTWVVPYNASLILKYDAHINLEVSSQRTIVKYLFKYMTKGPDEARVAVVPEELKDNEIEQYATKRYVGSSDAAWRTLEFDVTAREPNVKQLSVHLENQQAVYFKPGTEASAVRQAGSDLITYFNRPKGDDFDRMTYLEFYEHYIVHSKCPSTKNTAILETSNNKFITKRQRGKLVARLYWVAPNRGEQFYLRILLQKHPCRSYADLINLGGSECATFQDAAKKVGLADDEIEYERAMEEAAKFYTGPGLRGFFVLLAVNGIAVASMWRNFKEQLSEDIAHNSDNVNKDVAHNQCLIEINRMLRKHGLSLEDVGLLPPDNYVDNSTELSRERVEYDSNSLNNFVEEWIPRLSNEQQTVFDYVDKLCNDISFRENNETAIFIDGPAGTGKTLLLNVITAYVRSKKGIVLCTASSAIAAQNYDGGTTAHSMFKFPLNIDEDKDYWCLTNRTQRAELISHANVIIYDEAPMAHKHLIHMLDRSLQDLMSTESIFGGKIIIFAGDFRQIPPVVMNAKTNSDILNASVKTSPLWRRLRTFSLAMSQRCRRDLEFADFLLKLGSNTLPLHAVPCGRTVQNLVDLSFIDVVYELKDLIEFVFPILTHSSVCIQRAILCTRNDAVKEINSLILEKLDGEILHFYSIDKVENDSADELFLGSDALNRLNPRGVPEHDLQLKIGCICMIMRNICFSDGLVNGTKVIVIATSPLLITVQKSSSTEKYLIPRILFKTPIEPNSPFEMTRRQFPLQLCYAMTIHKSQGQTIKRVGLDLRSDMFSHGQLYVALGRVSDRHDIKILQHRERFSNGKPYAKNVVIPELL